MIKFHVHQLGYDTRPILVASNTADNYSLLSLKIWLPGLQILSVYDDRDYFVHDNHFHYCIIICKLYGVHSF